MRVAATQPRAVVGGIRGPFPVAGRRRAAQGRTFAFHLPLDTQLGWFPCAL